MKNTSIENERKRPLLSGYSNIDISDLSVNREVFKKVEIENEILSCEKCEKDGVVCHRINDRGYCDNDKCTHHRDSHRMVKYRYEKRVL